MMGRFCPIGMRFHRPVNQISGSERQRVALATLLTQDPEIFLMDEPNSHRDLHHQIHILDKLVDFARANNRAVIMILHHINLAARYCDQLPLPIGDGRYHAGTIKQLLDAKLSERVFLHPIEVFERAGETRFFPV